MDSQSSTASLGTFLSTVESPMISQTGCDFCSETFWQVAKVLSLFFTHFLEAGQSARRLCYLLD